MIIDSFKLFKYQIMRFFRYIFLTLFLFLLSCSNNTKQSIDSPDGKIKLVFEIVDGELKYDIKKNSQQIVNPSSLGLILQDNLNLGNEVQLKNFEVDEFNETWTPLYGEFSKIKNHYKS